MRREYEERWRLTEEILELIDTGRKSQDDDVNKQKCHCRAAISPKLCTTSARNPYPGLQSSSCLREKTYSEKSERENKGSKFTLNAIASEKVRVTIVTFSTNKFNKT
jgi:hypothetical protein